MRYDSLSNNGKNITAPFIKLDVKSSDKYILFKEGETRLDVIADEYWDKPEEGWLIMMANPEFGGLEWGIPDQTVIRVPYPYDTTINEYNRKIKELI